MSKIVSCAERFELKPRLTPSIFSDSIVNLKATKELDFSGVNFAEIRRVENPLQIFSFLNDSYESEPEIIVSRPTKVDELQLVTYSTTSEISEADFLVNDAAKNLIFKAFLNTPILSEDLQVSSKDLDFFLSVLQRKFGITISENSSKNVLEAIQSLHFISSKKRKEENRKYVFKRVTKVLRNRYIQSIRLNRKISKQSIDESFYKHYFGELSVLTGKPIEEFFLPGSCTNKVGFNKTFTDGYITLIKQSQSFRHDFERELQTLIESDVKQMVIPKISKMLKKVERQMANLPEGSDLSSFFSDKKGKLPWTCAEIKTAFQCVLQSFNIYKSKPNNR